MDLIAHFQLQAEYNRWMNQSLLAVCDPLPDAMRRRDLGAFFRSVHGTFNHLLLVDRLWLARLEGRDFPVTALDQEVHADWEALKSDRAATDARVLDLVGGLDASDLARVLRYSSVVDGAERRLSTVIALTHLFLHQIHHRGQLTTLLSQLGVDFGETDLLWMPGVAAPR